MSTDDEVKIVGDILEEVIKDHENVRCADDLIDDDNYYKIAKDFENTVTLQQELWSQQSKDITADFSHCRCEMQTR